MLTSISIPSINIYSVSLLLCFLSFNGLYAQEQDICKEGDCSSEIYSIDLDVPLQSNQTGTSNKERTEQFNAAYLMVRSLKNAYAQNLVWNQKYQESLLTGASCLRHYHLEGLFAYEYEQNPEFKSFIDQQESDIDAFKRNGFESSRRAINLMTRMKDKCSRQIKKLEEKNGPSLKDLPQVYMKLGQVLGYFDEQGNLIVNPDAPDAAEKGKVAKLKEQLNKLPLGDNMQGNINQLTSNLDGAKKGFSYLNGIQDKIKSRLKGLLPGPMNLLSKLKNLGKIQDALKLGLNGKPSLKGLLDKLLQLINKRDYLMDRISGLADKPAKLKDLFNNLGNDIGGLKDNLDKQLSNLGNLKNKLNDLINQKDILKSKLDAPIENLKDLENLVDDFTKQFEDFSDKVSQQKQNVDKLLEQLEKFKKAQEDLLPEVDKLEEQLNSFAKQQEELEESTTALSNEIKENASIETTLKEEEQAIKEEFGKEIQLDPVPIETWAESFEVKRPYWDAVFYPDDEVIDGLVGRYFEIKLKDSEKNVKLLFAPGKYYLEKEDFRNNYGSTIGAFVTEALHYMKKGDAEKVKLFIQGSADIAGHKTFRGKMDSRYLYDEVTVLPQKSDKERFSNEATTKKIPEQNFDNSHLPDLRGNYLKEMISVYSKKLKPILLEG